MPTSTNTLDWTLTLTAPDRDDTYSVVISRTNAARVHVSSVRLDSREDVLSSVLEIRFPSLAHFYDAWEDTNPFSPGSLVELSIEGVKRFTGMVVNFQPVYSAHDRSCVITCHDKMAATKDAIVEIRKKRRVKREIVNLTRLSPTSAIWTSAAGTYPWAEDFLIPVWVKEPVANGATKSYRVLFQEYKILYTLGGIYFNYDEVKVLNADNTIDPDGDGGVILDDYPTDIWAEIAYYDSADTTTEVDDIIREVFEYTATDGGLGWTDGVDFNLEDTHGDLLNKMDWHTKHGDGDCQAFLSNLYDNPFIGFPINYWLRDFEGQGVVTGKYVYQQSGLVFNGDMLLDPAAIPAGNWTFDAVDWTYDGVNDEMDKDANGTGALEQEIYARTGEYYRVVGTITAMIAGSSVTPSLGGTAGAAITAAGAFVRYIQCGATGATTPTRTLKFTPGNTARFSITDVQVSIVPKDVDTIYDAAYPTPLTNVYTRAILVNAEATAVNVNRDIVATDLMSGAHTTTQTSAPTFYGAAAGTANLTDGTARSSWGYFKIDTFDLDEPLPQDQPLFRQDFGAVKDVDRIILNASYTFLSDEAGEGQPHLDDASTGLEAVNGIYRIYTPQRITVEANTSTTATPDAAGWYAIHEDLFMADVTPAGLGPGDSWSARDAWKVIDGIGVSTRHIRVVVNNPMFAKVSNSTKGYRLMLWWLSEFQVYEKNRLLDELTGNLPEVEFTSNPADTYRYRFDLSNTIVDMYRPALLAKLNCYTNDTPAKKIGLAKKTLIIESNDMFDFQQKLAVDPSDVSVGFKFLVSRLDAASRENEWTVRINPRPDILIGDTVHCSRLDADRYYLVHGSSIELTADRASQTLTLSDHDFKTY